MEVKRRAEVQEWLLAEAKAEARAGRVCRGTMLLDAATAMVEPSPSAESAVVEAVVDAAGLALDQLRGAADALHMTRALSPIVYEVIDSLAAALAAYNDARGGRGT